MAAEQKTHSDLIERIGLALDDLYHSTNFAREGRSEAWDQAHRDLDRLEEQLETAKQQLMPPGVYAERLRSLEEQLEAYEMALLEIAQSQKGANYMGWIARTALESSPASRQDA